MRLGLVWPGDYTVPGVLDSHVAIAKIADDLGYEMICGTESWRASAIPWLAVMTRETSKITIGTSIINAFSRTPAAIAQDWGALDAMSGGRMMLGLGSSGAAVIEGFHGVPFERPLRRIREYIEIFRMLIAGERLVYKGDIFEMDRGFRLDYTRPRDRIPVYVASITPRSLRQSAEIADGVFPIHWPKNAFASLRTQLDADSGAAGREAGAVTIAPHITVRITDGTNDEQQVMAARAELEHYMNRMGVFYWQMFERAGYEAEVAASRAAAAERDRDGAIAAISEEMVRDIVAIGPVESVREQLQERSALGAELQLLKHLPGDPAEAGPILEALVR